MAESVDALVSNTSRFTPVPVPPSGHQISLNCGAKIEIIFNSAKFYHTFFSKIRIIRSPICVVGELANNHDAIRCCISASYLFMGDLSPMAI